MVKLANSVTTFYEHPDVMWVIIIALIALIGGLILILGWFVRREFSRFDSKLSAICSRLDEKADQKDLLKKADKEANDTVHKSMWKRVNTHGHDIECNATDCRPRTVAVLLHDDQ